MNPTLYKRFKLTLNLENSVVWKLRDFQNSFRSEFCNINSDFAHIPSIKIYYLELKFKLTTLAGSFFPGKYLIFSCSVLITSLNFLPSTISSKTHITTSGWNSSLCVFTVEPTIRAIAEPLKY